MPEFEDASLALGLVFPYTTPVSERRFNSWLTGEGFELTNDQTGTLVIGPTGPQISRPEEGIAHRDNTRILYNRDSNINGLSTSSFITVKTPEELDFNEVLEVVEDLLNWLADIGEVSGIAFFELTIDGLIRVSETQDLSSIFTDDSLALLEGIGGNSGTGITARFESNEPDDSAEWYRITFDENARGNPNLWGFKLVKRVPELDDIAEEELMDSTDEFLAHTESGD